MSLFERVLPTMPVPDLAGYLARGGGRGLVEARAITSDAVIDVIEASGLIENIDVDRPQSR